MSMDWIHSLITRALLSHDWLLSLQQFMQQGGQVLWWLAAVVAVSWLLVLERVIYLAFAFPRHSRRWIAEWQSRKEQHTWYAQAIRAACLGQAHLELHQNLNFVKLLVSVCPMLGLLGTVTGMISVFDVMATIGSSNPKLMASGISLATLPTMAGMVAALTGMFVHSRLVQACNKREMRLEKALRSQS